MAVPWLNAPQVGQPDGTQGPGVQGLRLDDVVTKLDIGKRLLGKLTTTLANLSPLLTGQVTLSAAASTTVSNGVIVASSFVIVTPINAAAGTLIKNQGLYWVASAGSFTISTASGVAAAGTESFNWAVFTTL